MLLESFHQASSSFAVILANSLNSLLRIANQCGYGKKKAGKAGPLLNDAIFAFDHFDRAKINVRVSLECFSFLSSRYKDDAFGEALDVASPICHVIIAHQLKSSSNEYFLVLPFSSR
jgi:hypothetical protein